MTATPSPDIRIREILARPVWQVEDMSIVFGIAPSTLEKTMREHPVNGMFTIGRRRHVMQDAAMAWIDNMRKNSDYSKRSNNPAKK